jgi:tetratricopeptide (TPR) repeat protein
VIRTAKQFSDYLLVLDQPGRFAACHRNYDFRAAVLPTTGRYRKLVRHLYGDPGWSLAYTDGAQALFLPDGSAVPVDLSSEKTIAEIRNELDARYEDNPIVARRAVYHLASLLFLLGQYQRAAEILYAQLSPEARALLARCQYRLGQYDDARGLCLEVLAEKRDDIDCLNLLALIALEEADFARALEQIEKVLRMDPYNPEARQILEGMRGKPTP